MSDVKSAASSLDEVSDGNGPCAERKPIDIFVGNRLKSLREACEMSLSDVSVAVGIPNGRIARYENGVRRVPPGDLIALVKLFDAGLETLFPTNGIRANTRSH